MGLQLYTTSGRELEASGAEGVMDVGSWLPFIATALTSSAITTYIQKRVPSSDSQADRADKRASEQEKIASDFRNELRIEIGRLNLKYLEMEGKHESCQEEYHALSRRYDEEVGGLREEVEFLRHSLKDLQGDST